MTDGYALLRAIEANPDEDTPRLAYADWLDEHGDSSRAEFIRLQCEVAAGAAPQVRARAELLVRKYGDAWRKQLPGQQFNDIFVRGFLDPVWVGGWNFVQHAASYTAAAPLHHLRLFKSPLATDKIAASPELRHARFLELTSNRISASIAQKLFRSPHLGNVRALNVSSNQLGLGGCKALAAAGLPALELLDLGGNHLRDSVVPALLAAPWFPQLKVLRIWPSELTAAGAEILFNDPRAAGLEVLDLGGLITRPDVLDLLARGALTNLRVLQLQSGGVTDEVFERLVASRAVSNLRELDLAWSQVTPQRVLAALDSPNLRNLNRLHLTVPFLGGTYEKFVARLGAGFNPGRMARHWYRIPAWLA